MSKNVTRLYKQFVPSSYKLSISISQDKLSFSGSVTIRGRKTGRPSQRITLHQKGLKISNARVLQSDKNGNETELQVSRTVKQDSYDEFRLHFENEIYPGSYTVSMDFAGTITDNMDGIYPSRFKQAGKEKRIIATQFESHHAREAFPCIDEPEAKATFDMSVAHAADEVALSNTPIKSESIDGKRKTTTYDTTPIMSTYLLAFIVGDIQYKEAKSKSGVTIRTYATAEQVKNTEFALDVAVKCMDYYEDYYDIPFPLGKCDFVALPDFASGAMENWGLITFREQALLVDPAVTSLGSKQWVALVVAHELTHQWFGNLVTMRWWTDLWLNEGFASWMEYLAVDDIFPSWHLWTQFAVDEQQLAMKMDALEHTHPIEVTVKHPDEIRTIFDAISYQKGASVIHMLHDYLGTDEFRSGIRHYLKTHAYKNTDTVDLWQALEKTSKQPVKEFMHAWTSKSGFPIVTVEQNNDHLVISQKRYVSNPKSIARSDDTLWPVPLLTTGLDRPIADKQTTNVPITGDAPLQINVGQTGFYRVNYSSDMQGKQLAAIEQGEMSVIDKMGLLADSFDTVKAGYQPVTEFLDLLQHFDDEDALSTWEIIAGAVGTIRATLSSSDTNDELRNVMKPFIQKLVSVQYKRLGWSANKGETHLDSLLRPIIISIACGSDTPEAIRNANTQYRALINDSESLHPDTRGTVLATIARTGKEKEYGQILDLYIKSKSSDEKLSITGALTSFEQPEIHTKILELIKTDTIRNQDISYWIAYSFMNRHSRQQTWRWLQSNWQWLKKTIGSDLSFSRVPIYAARSFADEKMLQEYKSFFTNNMEPTLERSFNQGLEIIETSTAWRNRDSKAALAWFTEK